MMTTPPTVTSAIIPTRMCLGLALLFSEKGEDTIVVEEGPDEGLAVMSAEVTLSRGSASHYILWDDDENSRFVIIKSLRAR
jgi:hypothetical protein